MSDRPVRKYIRLENFDYDSDGAYFITICTVNKECMLSTIVGGGAFDAPQNILTEYGKIVEKYVISSSNIPNVSIDNYVIMPNHIHILLTINNKGRKTGTPKATSPTNKTIPHFVSTLKRFSNRDIGFDIFQRSYHDRVIRSKAEYMKIWEYIENNPVKWQDDCYFVNYDR